MSVVERNLAQAIHKRRPQITSLDIALKALKEQHPGERKKPTLERNPEYMAKRSALLDQRRSLSMQQFLDRRTIREFVKKGIA